MYLATNCNTCHTIRGESQNIGPDLTQLGTRFSAEDIMKSVIDPNDVISDQYNATIFTLKDGSSIVGRLINDEDDTYTVSQNPYAPDIFRHIPKDDVLEKKMSTVSLMPGGTINSLNKEEVKDLLAYLIAGGDSLNTIYETAKESPSQGSLFKKMQIYFSASHFV